MSISPKNPFSFHQTVLDAANDDYFGVSLEGCGDLANSAALEPPTKNAVLPSPWPLYELKPEECRSDDSQDSPPHSVIPDTIRFANTASKEGLQFIEIDGTGRRNVLIEEMSPLTSFTLTVSGRQSFGRRSYILANGDGECLVTYTANDGPGQIAYITQELLDNLAP